MARDHVDPGKVTAQSAATQISQWTYICSAIKGSNSPLPLKKTRITSNGQVLSGESSQPRNTEKWISAMQSPNSGVYLGR